MMCRLIIILPLPINY